MTLAQRLLIAIGTLSILTVLALGLGVRGAWRAAEEQRFREQFAQALTPLRHELSAELQALPLLIEPLCEHDPIVDSALVGMQANDLDQRRLAIRVRVPELAKALRLDELYVLTSTGEVLGAHAPNAAGQGRALAALLERSARANLRSTPPLAVESGCLHRARDNPRIWVGVYAARQIGSLFERVGAAYDVNLGLDSASAGPDSMSGTFELPELTGHRINAARSRLPLQAALANLDLLMLLIGLGTFGAALVLALLLSKSLARPLVELAEQAGAIVHGEPKPIVARGSRELVQAAAAFNRAISDLTALRKRLAATERIAARREIARRVAHEIKNPLLPIRAAVETLRRLRARNDPAFDEYFDEATRTVLEEVARITHIVSEFTRFARLPAPHPAPFDVVESVRSVAVLHSANGARVEFTSQACPPLNADRDQILRLVTNLIQNAQHAAQAELAPHVQVDVRREGPERIRLTVTDNGPGLAPEMRERLFEPYATTKPEGTGLGLAIAERIAVEHGGDITYRDASGRGAEFRVSLPILGPTLLNQAPAPEEESR